MPPGTRRVAEVHLIMKPVVPPADAIFIDGYGAFQCPTRTQNDYDPDTDPADRDPVDPFTQTIMDAGRKYEDPVVKDQLTAAYGPLVVLDTHKHMGKVLMGRALTEARKAKFVVFDGDRSEVSLAMREDLTHALLLDPGKVRLLWNPRLRKWRKDGRGRVIWGHRSAEPDLLYRQNVRVAKSPKWGAIDVKHHDPFEGSAKNLTWAMSSLTAPFPEKSTAIPWTGTMRRRDALQLAHYHRALEFHGVAGSPIGGIIGKPVADETRVVWLNLNDRLFDRATTDALSLYDAAFTNVLAVAEREVARQTDPTLPHLAPPEWKAECKTCPWQTVCHDRLSLSDHISLLMGVTPTKLEVHYTAGISTVAKLALLDTTTAALVEAGVPHLAELGQAARQAPTRGITELIADLGLDARTSARVATKLAEAGITTPTQLAALDPTTASYPAGTKNLVASIDQARVVDFARLRRLPYVFRTRGIGPLEIPSSPVEIHVDMENDEHIYLWGMHTVWHYKTGRVRRTYHPYVGWDATDECEASVFADFWAGLQAMIAKGQQQEGPDGVRVFHYTAAEDRCMRHLADEYAGAPGIPTREEVEAFLASDIWVDLHPILTNQLIWPTEDGTLKSLAKYVQFAWRDDDPSGANSVTWYQAATDELNEDRLAYRQRIIEYNEDDCRATAALLDWLQERGHVNNIDRKLARVETLDRRYRPQAPRARADARSQ